MSGAAGAACAENPSADRPWLQIVGLGADGLCGLAPAARAALDAAEVVFGAARHHALTEGLVADRVAWPSPFDALIARIAALKGRRVAVLVTGDPTWFSAGTRIAAAFPDAERVIHPHPSAFQLAAIRLGWPLGEVTTLTVHGRALERVIPALQPGARLLVLTDGPETPAAIAALLRDRGFGPSRLVALSDMGGPAERCKGAAAAEWQGSAPAFHTLAIEVVPGPAPVLCPTVPGLDDALFAHDGTMTKREVRALTLAKLMPMPGARLWDVGAGAGSVAIEWLRAASAGQAVAIEPRADRRAFAAANAARLGTPELEIVDGHAPQALEGLAAPDAVFLGGGLSRETAELALAALRPNGRLVANAVTLESEAILLALADAHGGELVRLQSARAEPLGQGRAWRPAMPVTQWSLVLR
ncbi:MAG: precorrin-6y C5,15-methyltransferase (decarboxylating) subunit CbiE [Pikeienuella sp.]